MQVYSDRTYHDEIKNEKLLGTEIILLPRHFLYSITIENDRPFVAYQAISTKNDITELNKGWKNTEIPFLARGESAHLTKIIELQTTDTKLTIPPSGPFASSPIFIKNIETIAPAWKITYSYPLLEIDPRQWTSWQTHKKQITIFLLIYFSLLFVFYQGAQKRKG